MTDIKHASALLPCPFCGNDDLDVVQWVECRKCGAIGPGNALGAPLNVWNQRTATDPTLATVKPPRDLRTKITKEDDHA